MNRTKVNYWIDVVIAISFVMSAASGIAFLLPVTGATVLGISYLAWTQIHTWGSLAMLAGVLAHLVLHWKWIVAMTKKTFLPGTVPARTSVPQTVPAGGRRVFLREMGLGFVSVLAFGASVRWFLGSLDVNAAPAVTSPDALQPATSDTLSVDAVNVSEFAEEAVPAVVSAPVTDAAAEGAAAAEGSAVEIPLLPTVTAAAEPAPTSTPTAVPAVQSGSLASTTSTGTVRCPKRILYDPYPGKCRHYVDRDGDGYCDLSIPV